MKPFIMLTLSFVVGCTSEPFESVSYSCRDTLQCTTGYYCDLEAQLCVLGTRPQDGAVADAAMRDAQGADAQLADAHVQDALTPDAALADATPIDAAPPPACAQGECCLDGRIAPNGTVCRIKSVQCLTLGCDGVAEETVSEARCDGESPECPERGEAPSSTTMSCGELSACVDGVGCVEAERCGPCTPESKDFRPCDLPDGQSGICIGGLCEQPGCGEAKCNTRGPWFDVIEGSHELALQEAAEVVAVDQIRGMQWTADLERSGDYSLSVEHCKELNYAGHQDWRLPDIYEALTLVDPEEDRHLVRGLPALREFVYWTATATDGVPPFASAGYTINLGQDGTIARRPLGDRLGVICVRGERRERPAIRFELAADPGDGVVAVRDTWTGLVWEQASTLAPEGDALPVCRQGVLPSLHQISSLIDLHRAGRYALEDGTAVGWDADVFAGVSHRLMHTSKTPRTDEAGLVSYYAADFANGEVRLSTARPATRCLIEAR